MAFFNVHLAQLVKVHKNQPSLYIMAECLEPNILDGLKCLVIKGAPLLRILTWLGSVGR